MSNNEKVTDCILVSVDFTKEDAGVLIVGRKNARQNPDIINAFQGQEAWNLYQKLITKKE